MLAVISAAAGAGAGAAAHAFCTRWPGPRRPRASLAALAAAGGLVGAALALGGPRGTDAIPGALMMALLVPIVATDIELRLIPDVLTLPGTALCLATAAAWGPGPLVAGSASLMAALAFAIPAALAPGSVGWGDAKLAALLGAALGREVLTALGVAVIVGGVIAGALVVRHGRAARRRTIAFAPPLAAGALAALLLG